MDEPLVDRMEEIARRLDVLYGPRHLLPDHDPTSQLVRTILSQGTNDRNSGTAYRSLRDKYPEWQDVVDAPTADVAAAIAYGGLANQKAPRIQSALVAMGESHLGADALAALPVGEAMKALTSLDGVGAKTAACVLLFSLGRPIMPVDTHVGRVMTRLGIVPDRTSTVTKQTILTGLIDDSPNEIFAVHVETIEHGRKVCIARTPRCGACALQDLCAYFNQLPVSQKAADSVQGSLVGSND